MATIINDRDNSLQSVSPRLTTTTVVIEASGAAFNKDGEGTILPTFILLEAVTTVFTSPTYAWHYAINSAPDTWVSLGGGSSKNITGTTVDALIGLAARIVYRVVVTQAGFSSSTASITVTWTAQPDTAIYTHQLLPPSVRIGLDPQGDPYSLEEANSMYTVLLNEVDDTDNWTLTKVDSNVTSTLTDNVVQLTDFGGDSTTTFHTGSVPEFFGESSTSTSTGAITLVQVAEAPRSGGTYYFNSAYYVFNSRDFPYGTGPTEWFHKSTDGGVTWTKTTMPAYERCYRVHYIPSLTTIWVCTDVGRLSSTNGGTSWTNIGYPDINWVYQLGTDIYFGTDLVTRYKSALATLGTVTTPTFTYNSPISINLGHPDTGCIIDTPCVLNSIVLWPIRFTHTDSQNYNGIMKSTNGTTWDLCTGVEALSLATVENKYYTTPVLNNNKIHTFRYTETTTQILQASSTATDWTLVATISDSLQYLGVINGMYYGTSKTGTLLKKSLYALDWTNVDLATAFNGTPSLTYMPVAGESSGYTSVTIPNMAGKGPILLLKQDTCIVILLSHFEVFEETNAAPYYHYVSEYSYELTSDSAFGDNGIQLTTYQGDENSVYLNDNYDYLGIPFNGEATFEWRMKRPGGLQNTGLGNSESSGFYLEMWLDDYDYLSLEFSFCGSNFGVQRAGAGFRAGTENGPPFANKSITYNWTDSAYHSVRCSLTEYDTLHCHIDGDFKLSIPIGPLPTGTTVMYINWNTFKTYPLTTDQVIVDELRVIIGRAMSTAVDYTPAISAFLTTDCDDIGGACDPYWANVILLVQGGADPLWTDVILSCNFDSDYTDASPVGRTLTLNTSGSITATDPKFGGGALLFTGAAPQGLTSPYTADLLLPGDFTIRCWIKLTASPGGIVAIVSDSNGGSQAWKLAGVAGNKMQFQWYYSGGTQSVTTTTSVVDSTWHHIEVTRSGDTFRIFADGVLENTVTQAGIIAAAGVPSPTLCIGALPNGGGIGVLTTGRIDDLDITLGTARHTATFTLPVSANTQGADASLVIQDLSDYGDSVTITNYAEFDDAHQVFGNNTIKTMTVAASVPAFSSTGSASRFGRATGDKHTIECWVYVGNLENYAPSAFFFSWMRGTDLILEVGTYSNSTNTKLRLRNQTATEIVSAAFSTGVMHFLQMNIDNGVYTLDVDGVEVYSGTNTGYVNDPGTFNFYVAAQDASGSATGPTTEVWVGPLRVTKGVLRARGSMPTEQFWPVTCSSNAYDPFYTDTILILNCAQSNGSTTFIDTSPLGHTVGTAGGISITDQFAVFDGTNDMLRLTDATAWNFGTEDFTIEVVANLASLPALWGLITNRSPGVGDPDEGFQLIGTSAGLIQATIWGEPSGGAVVLLNLQSTSGTATTGLHNFCLQRSGSNFVLAYDGISVASGTSSAAMGYNSGFDVQIGNDESVGGRYFHGSMRVRVTKGVARYASFPYTPDTSPWPDPT